MAKLYEIKGENTSPDQELTSSLASSVKNGLLIPTEKKFALMERNMAQLQQQIQFNNDKQTFKIKEQLTGLEETLADLTKLFKISNALTLATFIAVTTLVVLLFLL